MKKSIENIGRVLGREEQLQINGANIYCSDWNPYFECCGECINNVCQEPCEPY
jgi:hypothetical protein